MKSEKRKKVFDDINRRENKIKANKELSDGFSARIHNTNLRVILGELTGELYRGVTDIVDFVVIGAERFFLGYDVPKTRK